MDYAAAYQYQPSSTGRRSLRPIDEGANQRFPDVGQGREHVASDQPLDVRTGSFSTLEIKVKSVY